MSRSYKGSKGPGYEYWGSRYSPGGERPGRFTKNLTHKYERRVAKENTNKAFDHTVEFHETDEGYQYDWEEF
jgi:hypothetical protein